MPASSAYDILSDSSMKMAETSLMSQQTIIFEGCDRAIRRSTNLLRQRRVA
jgi:hypothetical protein